MRPTGSRSDRTHEDSRVAGLAGNSGAQIADRLGFALRWMLGNGRRGWGKGAC